MKTKVIVVSLSCLALAACRAVEGGRVDSHVRALLSPDTQVLAGVHLDQLRATPLYRKLVDRGRLPGFDQFRAETGLDPDHDVRELLLASDGNHLLVIARGTFSGKRPGSAPNSTVTFVDNTTALAGSPGSVRATIDRFKNGRGGAPAALLARAEAISGNPQMWAVVSGWSGLNPNQLRNLGNAANLDRALRSVTGATLTVDFRSGMHAAATGDCSADQDAKALSDSLRALINLVRFSLPQNQADIMRAFDGIQVTQAGRGVKLQVDIPPELADKLADKP